MLILAGANRRDQPRVWVRTGDALLTPTEAAARGLTAEQIAAGRTEVSNGLLTALEVLGMDLSGTELVGLTACETGLGETTAGEGVIGLRRAFLLAGARSVVMSLWEVPLAETMALHERFYRGWLADGQGRFEAFASARAAALAEARTQRNGAAHPFYWAGFIYAGDPGDAPPTAPAR
ncbi:MAG: CHAT domain-containing protein [Phycisphaeraceae bacterium]|nr:CHAT domain-containing protein [Phycisphaeraceae bacterium]